MILAGVTISLVVGQGGLIRRSKNATGAYKNAQSIEESTLNSYNDSIDKIANSITPQVIYTKYQGCCLLENGYVYEFVPDTTEFDKDFDLTYITKGVKKISYNEHSKKFVYLTFNGDIYSDGKLMGSNVKELGEQWGSISYYIDNDNQLYVLNNDGEFIKIYNDVEKYDGRLITKTNGETCYVKSNDEIENLGKLKEYKDFWYITEDGKYYSRFEDNVYKKYADNVKEAGLEYYITNDGEYYRYEPASGYIWIASNVKKADYKTYLTNDGHLFYARNYVGTGAFKEVATDVIDGGIEGEYDYYYINKDNVLYYYRSNKRSCQKILDNVKEYNSDYIITYDNALYKNNLYYGYVTEVGTNVRENDGWYKYSTWWYISTNNDLYIERKKVGSNVKKFIDCQYSTNNYYVTFDNELFIVNNDTAENVCDNVKDVGYYNTNIWYITTNNDFYYKKLENNYETISNKNTVPHYGKARKLTGNGMTQPFIVTNGKLETIMEFDSYDG